MPTKYVTIRELAEHLGISLSTARKWVREGHIPTWSYIKVDETYRFNVPDVISALTARQEADDPAPDNQPSGTDEQQMRLPFDVSIYNQDEVHNDD